MLWEMDNNPNQLYYSVGDRIRAKVACFGNKRQVSQLIAGCSVKEKGNL